MTAYDDLVDSRTAALGKPPRRLTPLAMATGVVFLLLLTLAVFGDVIAPHDPTAQSLQDRLLPPAWNDGGTFTHLLGTDQLGRDLLSRLIAGAQTTLQIAIVAMLIEAIVGCTIGVLAGYVGGRTERLLMQWTDIQMAFPSLLIFMTIVLTVGGSIPVIILALSINGWMIFARVGRTAVRSLRNEGFIQAAIAMGAPPWRVMVRHVLPHIRIQIFALGLLEIARLILAESGASFLGLGVQPPNISWGLILGGSRDYIPVAYHLALFPGLAIVVAVLGLNVISRWVRHTLETRGRE